MQINTPDHWTNRDHGGDLDAAIAQYGGSDWIDLSTGINPVAYPMPRLSPEIWTRLPAIAALKKLETLAARYFAAESTECLALAGAQAGIQLLPRVLASKSVAVLGPTYNEHAACFRAAGAMVHEVSEIDHCADDVDTLVIVNPNNPDGRLFTPNEILALKRRFSYLIVDESFVDTCPENSVCSQLGEPGLFVLRSFGKFFGLAGLRLGFLLGDSSEINSLRQQAGPWSVSGPAIGIGLHAYQDQRWIEATRMRLSMDASRIDDLAGLAGWNLVGGCDLFRLYDVGDAAQMKVNLARSHIWSRIFPYSKRWIRLGLPSSEAHWTRVAMTLQSPPFTR